MEVRGKTQPALPMGWVNARNAHTRARDTSTRIGKRKLVKNWPSPYGETLRFLIRQHDGPTANTVEQTNKHYKQKELTHMQIIKNFIIEEEGAEIAEYALLVVILALALLAAAPNFG